MGQSRVRARPLFSTLGAVLALLVPSVIVAGTVDLDLTDIQSDAPISAEAMRARFQALEQAIDDNAGDIAALEGASAPVMPPGTIVAFGGGVSTVPAGWLLCDGSVVSSATYPALFAAIGTAHGGDGAPDFRLPDYRGRFLRGVDDARGDASGPGRDEDAAARLAAAPGGNSGNLVGSVQADAFQGHWHSLRVFNSDAVRGAGAPSLQTTDQERVDRVQDPLTDGVHGEPRVADETRPENGYVNYIIKN